ncbi:hypothetical protein BWD13_19860, partial [Leptospira santarosai serovar Grippotyphosa]
SEMCISVRTGAVAEATGLPTSLEGPLVGGSSMKDAVKAYVKDEATNAISKATGIPAWMISNQMEKMNKPKEQWYQSQEFQMVTTVVAVAAAPFTGGASLLVAMSIGAGIGAATGAASGGLKGALVGAVGGAAGAAVKSFTGGAVTVGLSYSAENGFGASVGVGYGPATVSLGISERGGTTVDLGLKKGGFNAGLSYNSKTGSVSGNAGFTSQSGTGFALSYNEGDGFGASISKSLDSGINGGLSWSQKGGVGGNIGYEAPGDKNQPKNSLANQMKGAGGSLSFNQRDGVSASVSASGGVNAGNWSQSGGFQANTNFLADQWKADFQSGKAKEDADAQEASRAAQNKNNSETGKSVLDGAAVSTQKREENILDHVLNSAGEALGGGLDWVGNKIDGAIDSVVGAASNAWNGVKNAFGPDKIVMMPVKESKSAPNKNERDVDINQSYNNIPELENDGSNYKLNYPKDKTETFDLQANRSDLAKLEGIVQQFKPEILEAWKASNPDKPMNQRMEQGFFIYKDNQTNQLSIVRDGVKSISHDTMKLPRRLPNIEGKTGIAFFHTHPNDRKENYTPIASPNDKQRADKDWKIPVITMSPEGTSFYGPEVNYQK